MSDKYQKAVEYLTRHPEEIRTAWNWPNEHPAGCLFLRVASSPERMGRCGCLTQVRNGFTAETEALTKAIRNDERIPRAVQKVSVRDLPVFAEWQARIDRELRCKDARLK